MKPIICLASKSGSRKSVLKDAFVRFKSMPSDIEEIYEGETVIQYISKLARQKCEALIGKTEAKIVVSADSVVLFNEEIIEKPKDTKDAVAILSKLQGRTHIFYTGLCVADNQTKEIISRIVSTKVTFSNLSEELIEKYVTRFQPFTFAGGYDNSISSWFIEKIEGSISNLMGLPMTDLREMVEELGFDWFKFIDKE